MTYPDIDRSLYPVRVVAATLDHPGIATVPAHRVEVASAGDVRPDHS
jgi:hypothetical protein